MSNETNKIPPRPTEIVDMVPSIDYVNHIVAVNEVAVEALRDRSMCSMGPYRGAECQCIRCEALRQIEESGWTP